MSKLDRTNGANLAMGAVGLLALGSILGGDLALFDALKGSGNKRRVWTLTKRKGRGSDVAYTISAKDSSTGRSVQGIVFQGGGVHWDYPDQVPQYIKQQAGELADISTLQAGGWLQASGSMGRHKAKGSRARTKWGTKSTKISAKQRLKLPLRDFVFPGDRRYPIQDKEHGRLALTYATWSATSRKDLPKVKAAVFARYPSLIKWWNNSSYVKDHPRQAYRQRRKAA